MSQSFHKKAYHPTRQHLHGERSTTLESLRKTPGALDRHQTHLEKAQGIRQTKVRVRKEPGVSPDQPRQVSGSGKQIIGLQAIPKIDFNVRSAGIITFTKTHPKSRPGSQKLEDPFADKTSS